MKNKRKMTLALAAVLALLLLSACAGGGSQSEEVTPEAIPAQLGGISTGEHKVIASVNGQDVYEDEFMQWYLQTLSLNYALDMSQELDEEQKQVVDAYKLSYLSSYLEQIAMYQEAQKEGLDVTDEAVEAYVASLAAYYGVDMEGFKPIMETMGFTDASLRSYLKEGMQISELFALKTQDITEPQMSAAEYYNEYPMLFRSDEERTVRHILVADLEEARGIIADLEAGTDFSDLVSRSTDPSAVSNNGVIGPFFADGSLVDGNGGLVEPFYLASFALEQEGEFTTEPVESAFGYHIIILDKITPPHTESFAEVEAELTEYLLYEEKNSFFELYYQELVAQAEIIYEEGYDPAGAN